MWNKKLKNKIKIFKKIQQGKSYQVKKLPIISTDVMSEYVKQNSLRSKIIKLKILSWERGKRKPTKRLNKKIKKSSVINHKIYII